MPDVTWTHSFLDVFLHNVPKGTKNVLDLGCGRGIVGALMRIYREPKRVVGVDIFDPYLDFCKNLGAYTELIKRDLSLLPLPFDDHEFDLLVALEVIEHLPKFDGIHLLEEMERVSKKVIVSTPNVYFRQLSYDQNIHQAHLSGWKVSDFRKRRYSIVGVGGLLLFGREIKYLSYILGRTTLKLPWLSSYLMAIYSSDSAKIS